MPAGARRTIDRARSEPSIHHCQFRQLGNTCAAAVERCRTETGFPPIGKPNGASPFRRCDRQPPWAGVAAQRRSDQLTRNLAHHRFGISSLRPVFCFRRFKPTPAVQSCALTPCATATAPASHACRQRPAEATARSSGAYRTAAADRSTGYARHLCRDRRSAASSRRRRREDPDILDGATLKHPGEVDLARTSMRAGVGVNNGVHLPPPDEPAVRFIFSERSAPNHRHEPRQ